MSALQKIHARLHRFGNKYFKTMPEAVQDDWQKLLNAVTKEIERELKQDCKPSRSDGHD